MNNAISRALKVVEYLTKNASADGETLTFLAKEMGLPKSSMSDIMETLVGCGYVVKIGKKFVISKKATYLGLQIFEKSDAYDLTRNYLMRLANATGLTTFCGIAFGDAVVYTDKVVSDNVSPIPYTVGSTKPIHITAVGKALLMGDTDDQIEAEVGSTCYVSYTRNSLINPHQLIQNIRKARENGFAVDNFEENPYIYGIAAPVYNANGEVFEAIGFSAVFNDIKSKNIDILAEQVKLCADELSKELKNGY